MVQSLNGLRHHAVISSHDEHRDIGGLGTASTHSRERLVARSIDEGDSPLGVVDLGLDLIGANGLSDTTGLAFHHVGMAQGVQQLRLAVVNVTHDGNNGGTCNEVRVVALVLTKLEIEGLQQLAVLVLWGHDLDLVVELAAQDLQGVVRYRLGSRDHLAQIEQHLHQLCRLGINLLGQIG